MEETTSQKIIETVDDHEEHPGQSLITKNHNIIMNWAKERDASPAVVTGTETNEGIGVLRLDFPGFDNDSLNRVSWDKWFENFDKRDLDFVFQEHLKSGETSNFFKIVKS